MSDTKRKKPIGKPSLSPQKVRGQPDMWFYETRRGLQVYVLKDGVTAIAALPWLSIMESAIRCGWKVRHD